MTTANLIKRAGIPVIITSAINVSAGHTVLTDVDERLSLTLQSIHHWRLTPMVSHVIVCDGSGFDLGPHINKLHSGKSMSECEVITFTNDIAKVRTNGKGYGEGEIVNYALQHSKVLQESRVFAKCTGKLWVDNFADCATSLSLIGAFDFYGKIKPIMIDTRFYVVNKDFYMSNLAALHYMVDDDNGFYLEHAFLVGLGRFRLSDYVMYPTPRINGVSGSLGVSYRRHRIKYMLRNARALFIKFFRLP